MDANVICLASALVVIVALVIANRVLLGRVRELRRQHDELAYRNAKLREQNAAAIALASQWQVRALHAQRRADGQEDLSR